MWLERQRDRASPGALGRPRADVCPATGHGEDQSFAFERPYRMRGRVFADIVGLHKRAHGRQGTER